MSIRIVSVRVVKVIGGNKRQTKIFRKLDQVCDDTSLNIETVVHDLDKEILRAKNVTKFCSSRPCFGILTNSQPSLDFPTRTTSRGDQTFAIGVEEISIHTWLEVIPLK